MIRRPVPGPPSPGRDPAGEAAAYACLVGAVLIWGASHLAIRVALESLAPLRLTTLRLAFSAAFLALWARGAGERLAVPRKDLLPLLGLGTMSFTAFQLLINTAQIFTTPAHASLMVGTMPIFAALAARLLLRERVTLARAGAILMTFVGVAIIILGPEAGLAGARNPALGDLLALGTAVTWALASTLSKPYLRRYSSLKFSAVTLGAAALTFLPFGTASVARLDWAAVSGRSWLALAFLSFLSTATANSLWNRGIAGVEVSRAAIFGNLIPVATLILSALLLGERLTLPLLAGGALVVAGTYLTQRT